jgi:hypothetical protein
MQLNVENARRVGMLFAVLLAGCGESTFECSITTEPLKAPADGTVTYEAFTMGTAAVRSVSYLVDGDETEVENPKLPWQEEAEVESGDTISISATGTAEPGGSFTARYSFASVLGGTPTESFASCSK